MSLGAQDGGSRVLWDDESVPVTQEVAEGGRTCPWCGVSAQGTETLLLPVGSELRV